ncbi:sulfotransferase family protein [Anianabacter salinae]|uniref:sulfotransferase family 2 domain-containing protein n=1 Tax=Anianabacter salinae TaxID=2851023 RepID=UPI00225E1309|nr:sulfotransferase family 2 domain-containing protein [Anianabacter salinae]MBV0911123.1 sulfotransferase family protein [Anianabacter salinae]
MIISHTRRLIVFSNPKTGSESLRALLSPVAEEVVVPWRQTCGLYPFYPHMPPREAKRVFDARGWEFAGYTRITTIRNPYARLVSLYRMIQRADGVWRMRQRAGLPVPGFAEWLRSTQTDGPGGGGRRHQRWRRFGTYSVAAWTRDAGGRPLVSHILRLEHLAEDAASVLQDIGRGVPHLNAAPRIDWQDWYDAETTALVALRYRDELCKFYPDFSLDPAIARAA